MKIKNQVCSLELAKRLKELGVKQNSQFFWSRERNISWGSGSNTFCSAFTVAELGKMLPTNKIKAIKWFDTYFLDAFDDAVDETKPIGRETDENESNARAKMLIHLIEKGVLKP